MEQTKGERREAAKRKRRQMKVSGRSVFLTQSIIKRKADAAQS